MLFFHPSQPDVVYAQVYFYGYVVYYHFFFLKSAAIYELKMINEGAVQDCFLSQVNGNYLLPIQTWKALRS